MSAERLNDFLMLSKENVVGLFSPFDRNFEILDVLLLKDNMSNSGYAVTTTGGKYLLKLYSNATDQIEAAVYHGLQGKVNIPALYYYDGSKQRVPYAYAVFEFVEGTTLRQYARDTGRLPQEIIYEVGKMCGKVHQKRYACDALLDEALNIQFRIPDTRERILVLLDSKAGSHLNPDTREKLRKFIKDNPELFDRIKAESVLCHGDFNMGNILCVGSQVYLIDFEFAYAGSRYHDIGQLFRRKGEDIQALINSRTYESFAEGYSAGAKMQLPSDWLRLAKACDIVSMLCLLDREHVPKAWISDVEQDVLYAMMPENTE